MVLDPNEVVLGNPVAKGAIARLGTEGREDGVVGVPRRGVGVTYGEALEARVVEGAYERDGEDGRVVHEVATVDEVREHGVVARDGVPGEGGGKGRDACLVARRRGKRRCEHGRDVG